VKSAIDQLVASELVFWDFDGVIKDSLAVKAAAFEELFLANGSDVVARVRAHHEANGGLSRFEKIPLYLDWSGIPATAEVVNEYCDRFSNLSLQRVIDSSWVPGVREYLLAHHASQNFVLLTSMPQAEADYIIKVLGISALFRQVFGSPERKVDVIAQVLLVTGTEPSSAIMVGDTETDMAAAVANGISFLLRRTASNLSMHDTDGIFMFDDLAS